MGTERLEQRSYAEPGNDQIPSKKDATEAAPKVHKHTNGGHDLQGKTQTPAGGAILPKACRWLNQGKFRRSTKQLRKSPSD